MHTTKPSRAKVARALTVWALALAASAPAMAIGDTTPTPTPTPIDTPTFQSPWEFNAGPIEITFVSANLLVNGDFSTGTLSGWDYQSSSQTFTDTSNNFLYVKDAPATLSQTFTVVAGARLDIQADYGLEKSNPNQAFSVFLNGVQLFSTTTATLGYAHFQASAIATGHDTLSFIFNTTNMGGSTPMSLDNASVGATYTWQSGGTTPAVPEPGSLASSGAGLAVLLLLLRRSARVPRRTAAPPRSGMCKMRWQR